MGTELPAYYKQQNATSQAAQQAGYTGQAGTQAQNYANAYGGMAGYSGNSMNYTPASNPLSVNTNQMLNYTPSNYQATNPYIADYSNPNMFNNTNIWNPYGAGTPANTWGMVDPLGTSLYTGDFGASTPASSQTYTSNLPGRVYQAKIPITGDISSWTQPDWLSNAIGTQWYTSNTGDPYLMAYATSPLSTDVPWNYINTLGYDPTTFMAMQQNSITGQGSTPTTWQSLVDNASASDFQSIIDNYNTQAQSINSMIDEYVSAITAAMTPQETSTTASTSTLGLPAGFRQLPMPAEYYGYAAALDQDLL